MFRGSVKWPSRAHTSKHMRKYGKRERKVGVMEIMRVEYDRTEEEMGREEKHIESLVVWSEKDCLNHKLTKIYEWVTQDLVMTKAAGILSNVSSKKSKYHFLFSFKYGPLFFMCLFCEKAGSHQVCGVLSYILKGLTMFLISSSRPLQFISLRKRL